MASEEQIFASILLKRIHESDFSGDKVFLTAGNDNQKFPIDTIVLAAASKYFEAALGPNFEEGEKEEFVLEGTDAGTVKAIVDYCYTGLIELTEENVGKFLAIASSVQLDLLEAKCRRFYDDNLSIVNCVDALLVAEKYSYADMRNKSFNLLCASFHKMPTAEFQKMEYRLVQEVLKCDKIQATEELVFTRLLEWFQHDETERERFMPELLKLIRLQLVAQQFISDTLQVVYERFEFSKLVVSEYKRRLSTQCPDIGGSRCTSILCLFSQLKGDNGAEQSAIEIERFNPVLNCFEEAGVITLGERTHFGMVLRKNKIFILGGKVNNEYLKSASAFDLTTGEEEILPEMNSARGYFVPISHGKYIYAFGGRMTLFGDATKSCERFDTETKTWTIVKEMNDARYFYSITRMNEFFCVAGGYSITQCTTSVEVYDPNRDEWTQFAPLNNPRGALATTKSKEALFAMGQKAVIEKFDPWKNRWTEIGSFKDSELITSAIDINGNFFVIMRNGEFGRIAINENDKPSFVRLGKSKNESKFLRRHYLCQNEIWNTTEKHLNIAAISRLCRNHRIP